MLELRPIWGFIFGLNLCLLIWRISVQEPALLEAEVAASGSYPQLHAKQQQQLAYAGKHLLADYQVPQQQQQQQQHQHLNQQQQQQQYEQQNDSNVTIIIETPNDLAEDTANSKSKYQIATSSHVAYNSNYYNSKQRQRKKILLLNSENNTSNNQNKTLAIDIRLTIKNTSTPLQLPSLSSSSSSKSTKSPQHQNLPTSATLRTPTTVATVALHSQLFDNSDVNDFVQLIDLQNFSYLLTQTACNKNLNTLILVHSAPLNYQKRREIRETWGSPNILQKTPIRLIFLLGTVADKELQKNLTLEYAYHNDILQGNFVDDYRNMTYKHVMAFKWFLYNCAHAQLLIKVDDDVFVNTPQLLKYILQQPTTAQQTANIIDNIQNTSQSFNASQALYNHTQKLLFCEQNIGARVKRTYRSKWRVSFKEYRDRFYPPYCPGYAIIYSADVVKQLYIAAQQHTYFWIDDVHITGVLAQQTNISITTSRGYVLSSDLGESLLAGKTDLNSVEFLFASHDIRPQKIRAIWGLYTTNETSTPASNVAYFSNSSIPLKTSNNLSKSLSYPNADASLRS